jgi:hypothetical protein
VTWEEYGDGLEERLAELHGRIHRGGYRAKPSRRVWIPKADGRQRPLGIATATANCTGQQIAFGMGRNLPSFPSAPRSALPSLEGAPNIWH